MPKPKAFLKETKSKKKATPQLPRTADEFLAVGVEQEEAGEKWRAGDAAKSLRFFMRAINTYDEGLQRHPGAFDLAYNKARVQYEITQHPRLATQLSTPLVEVLRVALHSHREALRLEQDNADALFNTAQVLTSLAEAVTDTKRPGEDQLNQAVGFLQEAIELFQRCLILQELRYTEMQEQIKQMESGDMGPPEEPMQDAQEPAEADSKDSDQEQWAAVVEPVTKDTLVDTAVAQLDALTTLCNLLTYDPGVGLNWVEEYSSDLLQKKISAYVEGSNRQYEASLARAKFACALNEVLYRSGRTEVDTYYGTIASSFGPDLDLSADPEGLCSKADALVSFNTATTDQPPYHDPEAFGKSLGFRWQALSAAVDALTKASKLPDAENLPKIHIARGDAEMSRWKLGLSPWEYGMAQQNGVILLRNAQTYYRGAAALARRDGSAEEERDGTCKEAIAAAIEGHKEKLAQLKTTAPKELMTVAEDMVEDGWVTSPDMDALLS
ncbi:hypothetical protein P175DRAFT_0532355 [Aspergillus ochraceoroseus IBT 24754]|uniref:Tetratricopeptide-like helical n=3 Tax=Aspergillus subgen. Nidulantes TaxID=2720870 RepID=A0A0F8X070_9EURO|nr:uncharacterized protein P175DRAFT_0532355 [Aspergillus ochraceoroseus IBT 24754]KKK23105.1 hypothetical protein ARAM_007408 [Aspergillus rambellii]KKK25251.1 hypothetical protein AOCH_007250 [Aspergillus ochraceoroseus]PTU20986.1 hypothetical protein P175DRAFT_0532355 [Aspergillus ochraceoroseus IBT 24754]